MSHRFCNKVQDAYSLRCCPQIHGVVNDTVKFVRGLISCEMNSATDNPVRSDLYCSCGLEVFFELPDIQHIINKPSVD